MWLDVPTGVLSDRHLPALACLRARVGLAPSTWNEPPPLMPPSAGFSYNQARGHASRSLLCETRTSDARSLWMALFFAQVFPNRPGDGSDENAGFHAGISCGLALCVYVQLVSSLQPAPPDRLGARGGVRCRYEEKRGTNKQASPQQHRIFPLPQKFYLLRSRATSHIFQIVAPLRPLHPIVQKPWGRECHIISERDQSGRLLRTDGKRWRYFRG